MNKSQIRKDMLSKRDRLTRTQIQEKSQDLFQQLYELPIYQNAKTIMCYVSIGKEVYTHGFIKYSLKKNKRIVVPVTKPDTKELLLSQVINLKEDLTVGHWGLLEPKKEFFRPISSSQLDLILVPGLAFTTVGSRLGYGGGYYDRFLSSLYEHVPTIGLAFEIQMIDKMPIENFDISMDFILTEKRMIARCSD